MGRLTILLAVASFGVAAGAAYLTGPGWVTCLGVLGVLLPLTALMATGWLARRRFAGVWPDRAWVLAPGALALAVVGGVLLAAAFHLPGPSATPVSIPVAALALGGSRIAGLLAALAFGAYALGAEGVPVRVLGAGVALAAVLGAQPVLRLHGLPVVGPVGLALAVALVALAGWVRRRWGSAGPGSPDPR